VVIRRFDSEERMVVGRVQRLRDYGFWKYLRRIRNREFLTIATLSTLTFVTAIASIAVFLTLSSKSADYWRAYLDRGTTTFLTAALTILITMILEYRAWVNLKVSIQWNWS